MKPYSTLIVCSLVAFTALPAPAQNFDFVQVAATGDPVPGGNETFEAFFDARAVGEAGDVVFNALDSGGTDHLYRYSASGVLSVFVENGALVNGGSNNLRSFYDVAISGSSAFFAAGGAILSPSPVSLSGVSGDCGFEAYEGFFSKRFSTSSTIVTGLDTENTPLRCFAGFDIQGSVVAFTGGIEPIDVFHNHSEGVFRVNDNLSNPVRIAAAGITLLPPDATDTFDGTADNVVLGSSSLVFTNAIPNLIPTVAGIYRQPVGSELEAVADQDTEIPGDPGEFFGGFDGLDMDGNEVAFIGSDDQGFGGVYREDDGDIRVVADRSTMVPGTDDFFTGFSNFLAAGGTDGCVAFNGFWTGDRFLIGLFIECNSASRILVPVLVRGDTLDGLTVDESFVTQGDLRGDFLLIGVRFDDGSEALYRVELL